MRQAAKQGLPRHPRAPAGPADLPPTFRRATAPPAAVARIPALLHSLRAARLATVKRLVERACCEPAFDLRRAARRPDLSERYIQKLFEETGVTFSEHLLGRRLCRARQLLLGRANDDRRIQDIAWACGRPSDTRAR